MQGSTKPQTSVWSLRTRLETRNWCRALPLTGEFVVLSGYSPGGLGGHGCRSAPSDFNSTGNNTLSAVVLMPCGSGGNFVWNARSLPQITTPFGWPFACYSAGVRPCEPAFSNVERRCMRGCFLSMDDVSGRHCILICCDANSVSRSMPPLWPYGDCSTLPTLFGLGRHGACVQDHSVNWCMTSARGKSTP